MSNSEIHFHEANANSSLEEKAQHELALNLTRLTLEVSRLALLAQEIGFTKDVVIQTMEASWDQVAHEVASTITRIKESVAHEP